MMHWLRESFWGLVVRRRVFESLALFCEEAARARVLEDMVGGVLVVACRTKNLLAPLRARADLLLRSSPFVILRGGFTSGHLASCPSRLSERPVLWSVVHLQARVNANNLRTGVPKWGSGSRSHGCIVGYAYPSGLRPSPTRLVWIR
jgi:hypothetical protein